MTKNMKTGPFIFFILLLTNLASGQNLEKGMWFLQEKQYVSAKMTFEKILKENPSDAKALYYLGQVYYATGKADSAEYCYQKGILAQPTEPYNYLGMGKIQLNKQNKPEWFKMYDKGRKNSAKLFEYNLEAADACLASTEQNYDLVFKYLEEAKELAGKSPNLFIGYGDLYLLSKSPGDAVNEYERAIYYDKNCFEAYVRLGEIFAKANNFKDAQDAFNHAVQLDSTRIMIFKLRGDLYYTFAKYQEAKKDYENYLKKADKNLEDQEKYVFILFFTKDYELAGNKIDELLKSDSTLTILYRIKAYIDYETGNFAGGLQNLQSFFIKHDTTKFIAQDFVYYGRLLIKNNQDSLGTVQLEKAVEMDSTKIEIYEDLAKSYAKQKKFKKSIDAFNKMIATNPINLQNTYYQIGRNYYFMAEDTLTKYDTLPVNDSLKRAEFYALADSSFKKVTVLSPDSYIGYIWRARTLSRLDPETLLGLAKPDYEQAMALLEKGDVTKTPKLLIECYRYLAFYYYLQSDKLKPSEPSQSRAALTSSLEYWNKILALDPEDSQAKTALENLKP
jgi:tetratricopeptide (TPR) repeat protein